MLNKDEDDMIPRSEGLPVGISRGGGRKGSGVGRLVNRLLHLGPEISQRR